MENKIDWEDIFSKDKGILSFASARAKAHGGWFVTHSIRFRDKVATSICFLPDENHDWELGKDDNGESEGV